MNAMDIAQPPKALASTGMGMSSARPVKAWPNEQINPLPDLVTRSSEDLPRTPVSPSMEKIRWAPMPVPSSRSLSPIRQRPSTKTSLTGDTTSEAPNRAWKSGFDINAWFQGSSAPMTLGLSSRSDAAAPAEGTSASIELNRLPETRSPVEPGFALPAPVKRLSFFGSRPSRDEQTSPSPAPTDAEFDDALGSASTIFEPYLNGTVAPSSIDALKTDVNNLLQRLQKLHQAQRFALQRHVADCETLQDQRDEADYRAGLFKTQFEAMAARLTEQDKANQELAQELAMERQRRVTEDEARKKSILLVKQAELDGSANDIDVDPGYYSEAEGSTTENMLFEQAPVSSSSSQLSSNGSCRHGSFDPEATSTPSSTTSPKTPAARPRLVPRLSTFQKVLKELSGDPRNSVTSNNNTNSNKKQDSPSQPPAAPAPTASSSASFSLPWSSWSSSTTLASPEKPTTTTATTSMMIDSLQTENTHLRDRIAELEKTVENCLVLIGT